MKLIGDKITVLVVMIFLLAGCRKVSTTRDLYVYINKVQQQSVTSIKPLPKYLFSSFKYQAVTYCKSAYSMHAFRLIGIISNKQKQWGLILLPNNRIIKVQKGDLVGREQAIIKNITVSEVVFSKWKLSLLTFRGER